MKKVVGDFNEKSYNLQVNRFVAAYMVIFNHAFPLAEGSGENELLVQLTGGRFTFGQLDVWGTYECIY